MDRINAPGHPRARRAAPIGALAGMAAAALVAALAGMTAPAVVAAEPKDKIDCSKYAGTEKEACEKMMSRRRS